MVEIATITTSPPRSLPSLANPPTTRSSAHSMPLALPMHQDLAWVTTPIITTTMVKDMAMDAEVKKEDVAMEAPSARTKARVVSTTLMLLPICTSLRMPSKYSEGQNCSSV
jgi:hypothetical protein